jgi:hypothetical protein
MGARLRVTVHPDRVQIGERFSVSFQRTLRVPEDAQDYPLPPGLGPFPIHRVEDYLDCVPTAWREQGGVFIPMYQREALWLYFETAPWKPNTVKVGLGGSDAISGGALSEELHDAPQDYIVCPHQPWLDGINTESGAVRQFVAMPLGSGYTVEGQLTGAEEYGGIQILVYEPKPGRFPDQAPPERERMPEMLPEQTEARTAEMGIAAGGKIRQKIYPDPYGIDVWDPENYGCIFVHIVNSEQYRALTGLEAPPTPISVQIYEAYGLPWFELYDEAREDIEGSERLDRVKTVGEKDVEGGVADDEPRIDLGRSRIKKLRLRGAERDG